MLRRARDSLGAATRFKPPALLRERSARRVQRRVVRWRRNVTRRTRSRSQTRGGDTGYRLSDGVARVGEELRQSGFVEGLGVLPLV